RGAGTRITCSTAPAPTPCTSRSAIAPLATVRPTPMMTSWHTRAKTEAGRSRARTARRTELRQQPSGKRVVPSFLPHASERHELLEVHADGVALHVVHERHVDAGRVEHPAGSERFERLRAFAEVADQLLASLVDLRREAPELREEFPAVG